MQIAPSQLLDVGDTALLVELPGLDDVLGLHAALERARHRPGAPVVEDLVPAERTLLIRFDPHASSIDAVRAWVASVPPVPVAQVGTELVELPVRYDGVDLDDVGRLTGLGAEGLVRAHAGADWTVAFTGFAPGFGYLVGGDLRLEVPRLDTPRRRVPAGAVALAGRYCGVYPRPSPGGWRIVGTTDHPVWDLHRDPPALLRPGVRVRFVPVVGP